MSEMIERVARAICTKLGGIWTEAGPDNDPDDFCDEYRRIARAAIEEMREPTTAMLFGTKSEFSEISLGGVWGEMIDAALK